MKAENVLIKESNRKYTGYLPQSIWEHNKEPLPWNSCQRLKRIPPKITCFFHRHLIQEVRKSNYMKDPRDNYYLFQLTDGTYLEVEY